MDTVSKPEHTEELAKKPNNIVAMWKRLWPLIISVGLFVLMGIAWNQPVVLDEHGCHQEVNWNALYVGLAANVMIAELLIRRLISGPGPKPRWIQYIISRTALNVVGTGVVFFFSSMWFSFSNTRIVGVIGYIGIAIVILLGYERERLPRYHAFIWLASLLLLIVIWYLAAPISMTGCTFDGFGPALGADV